MDIQVHRTTSTVHTELERDLNILLHCLEEHHKALKHIFDRLETSENTDALEHLSTKSSQLGRLRTSIHKKQTEICQMINRGEIFSLSEIYELYSDYYESDIGETGKECIALYRSIAHYADAIKIYFESKGSLYQNFIKNLYSQISPTYTYGSDGELKTNKSGVLVAKNI